MCFNCGCGNADDDMGNTANITNQTFHHLADHLKKTVPETKQYVYQQLAGRLNHESLDPEVEEMFQNAAKAWGQSVEEAKKNTFALLKDQLKV